MRKETWYNIENFNEYQVSNLGRVRRIKDNGQEFILKPYFSDKHITVSLSKNDGKHYSYRVAVLVLKYVKNNYKKTYNIKYKDGNPYNCNEDNIICVRKKDISKLTYNEIINIYKMTKTMKPVEISRLTGRCIATITNIKNRLHYKDIIDTYEENIEKWYRISGYDFYQVSNHGRVRNNKFGGRLLTPFLINKHYHVTLTENGISKTVKVSKLVIENVRGIYKKRHIVSYIDGDISNNSNSNLKLFNKMKTRELNDKVKRTRLSEEDVKDIFILSKTETSSSIAKKYNITDSTVYNIKNRKFYTKYTDKLV